MHTINELFGFELQQDYKQGPYYRNERGTMVSTRPFSRLNSGPPFFFSSVKLGAPTLSVSLFACCCCLIFGATRG